MADDPELAKLLSIRAGGMKIVDPNETVGDIAARTPGGVPKFTVMKKETVDAFNKQFDALGVNEEKIFLAEGIGGSVDRLKKQLIEGGMKPEDIITAEGTTFTADGKVLIDVSHDVRRQIDKLKLHGGESDEQCLNRLMDVSRKSNYMAGTPENALAEELAVTLHANAFPEGALRDAAIEISKMPDLPADVRTIFLNTLQAGAAACNPRHYHEWAMGFRRIIVEDSEQMTPEKRAIYIENVRRDSGRAFQAKLQAEMRKSGIRRTMAHAKIDGLMRDIHNVRQKQAALKDWIAACEDIEAMCNAPMLGRLTETCYHKCVESWRAGRTITPRTSMPEDLIAILDGSPQIFLVQHDWAAAFKNATDFSEGDFRLPYEESIFEFRIAGRRTCAGIASDESGMPSHCLLHVETKVGWALAAAYRIFEGQWVHSTDEKDLTVPLFNVVRDQVRAIAIALEANVATSEVVRAPYRLNQKREKSGKLPIFDYHAVSLARRVRILPREPEPGEKGTHRSPRLHFVRGHFRHYESHKTWINWHLRGNSDLGFVDKEYRL